MVEGRQRDVLNNYSSDISAGWGHTEAEQRWSCPGQHCPVEHQGGSPQNQSVFCHQEIPSGLKRHYYRLSRGEVLSPSPCL